MTRRTQRQTARRGWGLALLLALLATPAWTQEADVLRIAHVSWSSSQASAHVVAEALERRTDVRVELTEMPVEDAWRAVAEGEQDAYLSAWLPSTHASYLDTYGDAMVDLGPNLEGTRTGLLVPDVGTSRQTDRRGQRGARTAPVTSIPELREHAETYDRRIIGIDPGAGVMAQTREAMEAYGLEDWDLVVTGSEQAMIEVLQDAVRTQEPVVVTGWVPLWVHARWSLRFLDDPQGIYGDVEAIHTMVREGLEEDLPAEAFAMLDGFTWEPDDMQRVMIWMQDARGFPRDAARRWLASNEARVATWFDTEEGE